MAKEKGDTEAIIATPFVYEDLVNYQTGSIVSRTIIDKLEGSVTIFAFDKGQRLSEHTAPFDALIEIVDGTGIITIDGMDFAIQKGKQIIMPAGHPHAVRAEERFKMTLIMVRSKKKDP